MTNEKDGGPAFPCEWMDYQPLTGTQVVRELSPGISIRDYFAAKAITPIVEGLINGRFQNDVTETKEQMVARYVYKLADAMLKERSK